MKDSTPEGTAANKAGLPRFLGAIEQYEDFLKRQAAEAIAAGQAPEQIVLQSTQVMSTCSTLTYLAQTYDFMADAPGLRETSALADVGRRLITAITNPELPDEVRTIYQTAYTEELSRYAPPPKLGD